MFLQVCLTLTWDIVNVSGSYPQRGLQVFCWLSPMTKLANVDSAFSKRIWTSWNLHSSKSCPIQCLHLLSPVKGGKVQKKKWWRNPQNSLGHTWCMSALISAKDARTTGHPGLECQCILEPHRLLLAHWRSICLLALFSLDICRKAWTIQICT